MPDAPGHRLRSAMWASSRLETAGLRPIVTVRDLAVLDAEKPPALGTRAT
jgi:hypothetical protein